MTRVMAETLLVCALVLALYQSVYYQGRIQYANQQEAFMTAIGPKISNLTTRADEITTGMNDCWQAWRQRRNDHGQ